MQRAAVHKGHIFMFPWGAFLYTGLIVLRYSECIEILQLRVMFSVKTVFLMGQGQFLLPYDTEYKMICYYPEMFLVIISCHL